MKNAGLTRPTAAHSFGARWLGVRVASADHWPLTTGHWPLSPRVHWPLSPRIHWPLTTGHYLGQAADQIIDSSRLVCDDERLSRKWRRQPCLIRSSKTRSSTRPFANPTGIGGSPTRGSPTR